MGLAFLLGAVVILVAAAVSAKLLPSEGVDGVHAADDDAVDDLELAS
jgi:hypothetical protein